MLENRESRERQYALAKLAQQFGWPADRVLVIDEDQGHSGKFSENRGGFQRLLTEVALDHVGLVLGLELSRLARSCKDWHHLVELCAVFDTLLYDQDGVYNANDSNDRLLLGMKGAMSEYELITLRNRLERGRDNKAARGDLFLHLPTGLHQVALGRGSAGAGRTGSRRCPVGLRQVRGTGHGVASLLLSEAEQDPIRLSLPAGPETRPVGMASSHAQSHSGDAASSDLCRRLRLRIHRPVARTRSRVRSKAASGFLSPDEIRVLIQDRVPAYISWEQYLANQRRISENRSFPGSQGRARAGKALLSGLIVCGRCRHRMNVGYQPEKGKSRTTGAILIFFEDREQPCFGLKAPPVDELVAQQVLRALEPAAVELSLQAATDIKRERERLHQHWRQRLERAQYESQRARTSVSERRTREPSGGANAGATLGGGVVSGTPAPRRIRSFLSGTRESERRRHRAHPCGIAEHLRTLARGEHDSPRSQGNRALPGGSCCRSCRTA